MIMGKIITISRQYGSGGSEIGRKVAKAPRKADLIPNT